MARIVFADDGIEFDGKTLEERALGGVESSVILMMEEFAKRGHEVLVRNKCKAPMVYKGVDWAPIDQGMPEEADLYIANRGDKLIDLMPKAKKTVFWTHNPCRFMVKWRYIKKFWKVRPTIVFIGTYHADTLPGWVPDGGRTVIPYGIPDMFRHAEKRTELPAPRAIFTSNPLRGLDWLLDLWERDIHPKAPDAELHVFGGPSVYGSVGAEKAALMEEIFNRAESMADQGIVLRGPATKTELIDELQKARLMCYRGDINETYCLAVAEAQALGTPTVVQDFGSMAERVVDGKTGVVAKDDPSFSAGVVKLLTDGPHWFEQHENCLATQRNWGWEQACEAFEELI
ncbi:glycosyltransferase family 4 protein [Terasakiella sp. A23]|uniref:glycosyltransferase family 4 protein n=1 Tax=Terasakiella sp. FCG-A23 TaxID=3080561 RepID=UPI00295571B7|nr:glycosyltransferase family 4 protein [Terasakiella sp. A23]MDV7339204.1 glycosyltransferase family 4 protein [Terasakiella sp. A23]